MSVSVLCSVIPVLKSDPTVIDVLVFTQREMIG